MAARSRPSPVPEYYLVACFYCDRTDRPDEHGQCRGCGAPRGVGRPKPKPKHSRCERCGNQREIIEVAVGFPRSVVREFVGDCLTCGPTAIPGVALR